MVFVFQVLIENMELPDFLIVVRRLQKCVRAEKNSFQWGLLSSVISAAY